MKHPAVAQPQAAVVLRVRPYRESSLLVELLSEGDGRVGVVARGARRPRSALKGILQPFALILASWSGRGELGTLRHAERGARAFELGGDALLCAYYAAELVLVLLARGDPHPATFQCLRTLLGRLGGPGSLQTALRWFELRLLQDLGYGLVLDREAETGAAIRADAQYRYRLEHGAVAYDPGNGAGIPVGGDTLIALREDRLAGQEQLREAKTLLQHALQLYLGERSLKTREVLRQLHELGCE